MSQGIHIYGNWKMNKTRGGAREFFDAFLPQVQSGLPGIGFAVPFTEIHVAKEATKGTAIAIGAQTVSEHAEGAYTGEISTEMLFDVGASFTLIGHSERRHLFNEGVETITAKVARAQAVAMRIVFCVGETEEERDRGAFEEVVRAQLASLSSLSGVMVAYEPVWAIGTGKVATPDMAQEAHHFIRSHLAEMFGEVAAETPILYGGSVKPDNIAGLITMPDINGALVGGASLAPEPFAQLINTAREAS